MKSYIFFLFILFSGGVFAQGPYMVTNSSMDDAVEGSLPYRIIEALGYINDNPDSDVIIYLNLTDLGGDGMELIPVSEPMPYINNETGSVTIKPDPNAVTQGFELLFPGSWGDYDALCAITAYGSVELTIDELNFENFSTPDDGGVGVRILKSQNVHITNCNFLENSWGMVGMQSDLEAGDNVFENNYDGIIWTDWLYDDVFSMDVNIHDNVIDGDGTDGDRGMRIFLGGHNADITIEDNIITNIHQGISVNNNKSIGQTDGVHLISNEMTDGGVGIILQGVRPFWEVTLNEITDYNLGYWVFDTFLDEVNDAGIDFINGSDLDTEINPSNLISNCGTSFHFNIRNPNKVYGYNVEGKMVVSEWAPTFMRENTIRTPVTVGFASPIELWYGGNEDFDPITLDYAFQYGPALEVTYTVDGSVTENLNFVVEFFEADAEGDIIQYLGNQFVVADGTFSVEFDDAIFTTGDRVGATITSLGSGGTPLGTSEVEYITPTTFPCDTCNSFKPVLGEVYWLSAWTKVGTPGQVKTYAPDDVGPNLELQYFGSVIPSDSFYPTGEIIDGWQRIVGKFTVPSETLQLRVILNSDVSYETYFDDIRIHPFNGSMKSYVYDGETFWLTSELDDNNYATFYEYDQEGGLIRIKKETSRGIVTIQETRSGTIKD